MKPSLLLFFLIPVTTAVACLNTPAGTSLSGGHAHGINDRPASILSSIAHSDRVIPRNYGRTDGGLASEADTLQVDALNLIVGRRYAEALPLLQKAESLSPGSYSLAANLGTNYELVGNNKAALEWIRKAVALDPNSHRGSEWVHVLVLEAKVREETATGTGLNAPLVPVPDTLNGGTLLNVGGKLRTAQSVHADIYYQLQERLQFVKPMDPYVADLLFSLAVLDANLSTIENAQQLLNLSVEYGYDKHDETEKLNSAMDQGLLFYRIRVAVEWIVGITIVVGLIVFALRKKWITLTRASTPALR